MPSTRLRPPCLQPFEALFLAALSSLFIAVPAVAKASCPVPQAGRPLPPEAGLGAALRDSGVPHDVETDYLHLTPLGYRMLADALDQDVTRLLK